MCTERYFDARVFSTFPCYQYHSIQKETLFPMTFANPDYRDFASRKTKVNEIVYCNPIHFIQNNVDKSVPAVKVLPNFLKLPDMPKTYLILYSYLPHTYLRLIYAQF